MFDKGNCSQCGRKIQATIHDKCLFCGQELEDEQKFSDEEKESIMRAYQHRDEMNRIENSAQRKRSNTLGIGVEDLGFDIDLGDF